MRVDKYDGNLRAGIALAGVAWLCLGGGVLAAQLPGTLEVDRARTAEITGDTQFTVRRKAQRLWVTGPDIRVASNSALPYSLNDGPLWAGRGLNASLTEGVGARVEWRRGELEVVVAPTFTYSQNLPFDIKTGVTSGRSTYSSPWHTGGASADLPIRFGDQPLRVLNAGQSSVTLRLWNTAVGVSTASQWWGPGIRNALVVSDNAAGVPRAFIRNAQPIRTLIGRFSAELQLGTLTKSLFFDTLTASNYRSFSGLLVSYRPKADSNLTLGVARAVYAPSTGASPPVRAVFHALRGAPTVGGGDSRRADQVASIFARWVFPKSGLEVYGELARMDLPRSLADFLQTPDNSGGYTIGFQWAIRRAAPGHILRVQSEVSFLDQNGIAPDNPPVDFYTGRVAAQGYTQRGQVIGAAIGPGGSSQWTAVDYLAPRWQVGVIGGRTRWEENALLRERFASMFGHDVSMYYGVRGGVRFPWVDASTELTISKRFNFLLQNGFGTPGNRGTVNVQNVTFTTRISCGRAACLM